MTGHYNYEALALLRNQLLFAPIKARRRLVFRLEKLLAKLDPEKAYPYEYICHKITNFRPTEGLPVSMGGKKLQDDLLKMVSDLGSSMDIRVKQVGEQVHSMVDMMIHYGISAKTLYRWRKKGLVGYMMVFPDGKRRLGFKQSALHEFEEKFKDKIDTSARFRLMDEKEQLEAVRLAREAAKGQTPVFSKVVETVAGELKRSRETIRYMLKRYEQEHPDERIFPDLKATLSEDEKEHLFRLYLIGVPMRVLCREYSRNRSTIYRIIYQIKAREIMDLDLSYIYNPSFDEPNAVEEILGGEEPEAKRSRPVGTTLRQELIEDLPVYLRDLHAKAKLLTREEEWSLFRRMNYLKHRVAIAREQMKVVGPQAHIINQMEALYQQMVETKQRIIRANLRLVVSIAKRHTRSAMDFNTLISDGNLSLMQAVEKFDYAKGNRFSTYASWAIMKNYAKTIPEENDLLDTFRTTTEEILELVPGVQEQPDQVRDQKTDVKKVLMAVLRTLTDREREIIVSRFGLTGNTGPATLEEIGTSFNLSKERIRQIEAKALKKLRAELSPEQIDSLLG